ncbi:selenocysteine lyase/cysteine desulfurase [Dyadobacter jejuensis]|uniref:Selenocysteine lyase/cysteine desulfurase n=1 Tax=Dyadobacter jejuensis TaxID=1082580 RepID=A0A316AS65_9BACT|nr:aminotransferase class V-fold PLP-dependent enzyme [Dyadobacter jejuensis]PWJ60442.1 selenocysteine lyase/cysteine desulfurase [Dyadobacter jejuensis]
MNNRRSFFKKSAAISLGAFGAHSLFNTLHAKEFKMAESLLNGEDGSPEDYWSVIQEAYTASKSDILILNNGGVSPSPTAVQVALERYNLTAAQGPSYYMWRIMDKGREPLRQRLAGLAGVDADEVAINRNATEALNTVIFGMPLQKGDEVIGTTLDYPNMMHAWNQRKLRDGIVYKQLVFDFPIENDDTIVKAYEQAITPKTKVIHITHIINWVGQIMPVRKISQMAHKHGIEVIVDGAHSFGLLDFKIPDLECDYFGTSLHKFLSAPLGTGMMWIKKDKIAKIFPLSGSEHPQSTDIRKFETLGTRSFCIEQAIGEAINFQEAIGSKRKEERVHFLKHYWGSQAIKIPGVRLHTSLKPEYSCAIAGVTVDGLTPQELDRALFKDFKIHTTAMVYKNVSCVRVTPHVYTSLADLDHLLEALDSIARKV